MLRLGKQGGDAIHRIGRGRVRAFAGRTQRRGNFAGKVGGFNDLAALFCAQLHAGKARQRHIGIGQHQGVHALFAAQRRKIGCALAGALINAQDIRAGKGAQRLGAVKHNLAAGVFAHAANQPQIALLLRKLCLNGNHALPPFLICGDPRRSEQAGCRASAS